MDYTYRPLVISTSCFVSGTPRSHALLLHMEANFNDKIDRALEHGAKKVNAVLGGRGVKLEKTSFMIHPKKDLLKNVRHTPEYIKLKKRFDALFLWPAFLSLLKPEKENRS
jgi:hypothetical protein